LVAVCRNISSVSRSRLLKRLGSVDGQTLEAISQKLGFMLGIAV
jgi:mRNA-degrading endonuclease toxin of MazEF toxin-antitoxin module